MDVDAVPAQASEPYAAPDMAIVLSWIRWAAWLTAFLCVILPYGCVIYLVAALYQQTLNSWATGRRDHTPPDAETAIIVDSPFRELGG